MKNIKIFYSDEDEGWIATCDDFPGLSGFGDTKAEAKEELTVAFQGALLVEEENEKKKKSNQAN